MVSSLYYSILPPLHSWPLTAEATAFATCRELVLSSHNSHSLFTRCVFIGSMYPDRSCLDIIRCSNCTPVVPNRLPSFIALLVLLIFPADVLTFALPLNPVHKFGQVAPSILHGFTTSVDSPLETLHTAKVLNGSFR